MIRALLVLAAGIGLGGAPWAGHDGKGNPKRAVLSVVDVAEKIDGKEAKATTVELTLEPGQSIAPHRHPGPVFGFVIEGEFEWAIDDRPVRVLKAGDTFYEPTGCLHRVSKNPVGKGKTRVLAVVLHPRDAKEITIPELKRSDAGRRVPCPLRGVARSPRMTNPHSSTGRVAVPIMCALPVYCPGGTRPPSGGSSRSRAVSPGPTSWRSGR